MSFENPAALLWGLLAAAIVLLYARKEQVRREATATGMFWDRAIAEEGGVGAWRRWRKTVSLAVQLTILACLVLTLADPQVPAGRHMVLIVDDTSQSGNESAWRRAAEELIEGMRPSDRLGILSTSGAVGVRCNMTGDRAILQTAIRALPEDANPSVAPAAVDVAQRMLGEDPGGVVLRLGGNGELSAVKADNKATGQGPAFELWLLLIVLAIGVLVGQWYTYQRRWSC